jgi:undecaprenyl-diphosphatase
MSSPPVHPQQLADIGAVHALPLYLCALCAALAAAAGLHALARRCPPRQLAAIGAGCALGAALLFAAIACAISGDTPLARFDHALAAAMQAHQPDRTLRLFAHLTHFGDTAVLTLLCIVGAGLLLARRQRALAAMWVAAIGGNSLLNRALKSVFERTRPPHEHGHAFETSWSFPSGHSSGTLVAYGMAAYVLMRLLPARWHRPLLLAFVAITLSTAISRVILQVHFASDVLAGLASGTVWLMTCIAMAAWLRRRPPSRGDPDGTRP